MELYYLAYLLYIKLTGYHPRSEGLAHSQLTPAQLAQRLAALSPRQKRMAPVSQLIAYLEQAPVNNQFEAWLDSDLCLSAKSQTQAALTHGPVQEPILRFTHTEHASLAQSLSQALAEPNDDSVIQASMQAFKALVSRAKLQEQAEAAKDHSASLANVGSARPDLQDPLLSARQAQVASLTITKPEQADLALPSLTTLFKLLPYLTHTPEQATAWQNLLQASLKLIFPELSTTTESSLDTDNQKSASKAPEPAEQASATSKASSLHKTQQSRMQALATAEEKEKAGEKAKDEAEAKLNAEEKVKEPAFGIKLDRFGSPTENLFYGDFDWLTRVATKGKVCFVEGNVDGNVDGNQKSSDLLSLALKCHLFNIADLTNVSGVSSRYQLILADLSTKLEHLPEARLLGLSEHKLLAYIQYSHWQLFSGGLAVLWVDKAGWNQLSQLAEATDFFTNHAQCLIDGGNQVLLLVHKLTHDRGETNSQQTPTPTKPLLHCFYSPSQGLYLDCPGASTQQTPENTDSSLVTNSVSKEPTPTLINSAAHGAFSAADQAQTHPATDPAPATKAQTKDQSPTTNQLHTPRFLSRAERAALTAQSDLESLLWSAQPVVNQDTNLSFAGDTPSQHASANPVASTASATSASESQVAVYVGKNPATSKQSVAAIKETAGLASEGLESEGQTDNASTNQGLASAATRLVQPYPLTLLNPVATSTESSAQALDSQTYPGAYADNQTFDELTPENLSKLTVNELEEVFAAKLTSVPETVSTGTLDPATSYPALLMPLGKITNRVGLRKVARNGKPGSVALIAGGKVVNYIAHPEALSGPHVIVCASGSRNIIGRSLYFESDFVAADSFVLSGIAQLVDTRYLYFWLKGRQEELLAIAKEKNRIYSIPAGSFEEVLVPVPSLAVQRAIVAQLEQLEKQRAYHEQELAELNKLEAQLYQGSFSKS